jgi:hypothetical protein
MVCRCDGTGKLDFSQTHLDRVGNKIGFTQGSHPCPCRSQAEPRYGKASWWSSEQIHHEIVHLLQSDDICEITVTVEVPYSEDNYRLHRTRENRYYPASIQISGLEGCDGFGLLDYHVEELAAALNRALVVARKADEPAPDKEPVDV